MLDMTSLFEEEMDCWAAAFYPEESPADPQVEGCTQWAKGLDQEREQPVFEVEMGESFACTRMESRSYSMSEMMSSRRMRKMRRS